MVYPVKESKSQRGKYWLRTRWNENDLQSGAGSNSRARIRFRVVLDSPKSSQSAMLKSRPCTVDHRLLFHFYLLYAYPIYIYRKNTLNIHQSVEEKSFFEDSRFTTWRYFTLRTTMWSKLWQVRYYGPHIFSWWCLEYFKVDYLWDFFFIFALVRMLYLLRIFWFSRANLEVTYISKPTKLTKEGQAEFMCKHCSGPRKLSNTCNRLRLRTLWL